MPCAVETLWFNRPAIFVHDRFLTRVHDKEDAMVLQVGSIEMRDMMLEVEPDLFYITDHYRKFPFLLARLSALTPKVLTEILAGRARQLAGMKPIRRRPKKSARKMPAKKKKG